MNARLSELDPEMASLLLMGESAQAHDDFELARRCYEAALEHRPHHPGAMLNLGIARVELWQFEQALEVLDALEADLQAEIGNGTLVELRLSGRYNAALAHWYLACPRDTTNVDHLGRALITARRLALDIPLGLARHDLPPDRRHIVEALEGATLALLMGVIVDGLDAGVELGAGATAVDVAPISEPARAFRKERAARPPAWLERLAGSHWYETATVAVLGRALTKEHKRDARTRYNLAVARARLLRRSAGAGPPAPIVDAAFADLEYAVTRDAGHVRWAAKDRLIAPLRDADPERFGEILHRAASVA